jgi:hypothetical protein
MMGYEGKFNSIHVSPFFNNVVFVATAVSQFSEDRTSWLHGYEKGGMTLKTPAMLENIIIIDSFLAMDQTFIVTATKKEVAIWTIGEANFDELI